MSVGTFLKNSGWAAIAIAMVAGGLSTPASAQNRGERAERSQQVRSGADQRRQMGQRAAARQQARERQTGRQATQPPHQIERPARQEPRQGNWQQGQRGERPATQPPRQGNWQQGQRPAQPPRQVDRRPDRRDDQRAERQNDRRGDWRQTDRNRGYADRDRNWSNNNRNWNNNDRRWQNDRRNDGWRGDRQAYRQWDRRWRDNNRYNWQRYRNSNRVVFQVGTYYAPYRNYSYRRVGIGGVLDSLFFGSQYWISDPWQYRLPEAYGPYRWVRYYDDALLVDTYSGQVVDVIHDFFW